jgi:hypothetical protein
MACRKGWSREVLVDNFSQKFVSRTYKERREELLLEREKSMMPATQPYVETERRIRQLTAEIATINTEVRKETETWHRLTQTPLGPLAVAHGVASEFEASIIRHKTCQEQRKVLSNLALDIQHLEWQQNQLTWRLNGNALESEKRQFVRACPYNGCKGSEYCMEVWRVRQLDVSHVSRGQGP